MQKLVFFAIAALFIAGTASQFADRSTEQSAARKPVAAVAVAPGAVPVRQNSGPQSATVRADRRGHYQVNAAINGRAMALLVDTGASVVALTREDARRLGLNPSPGEFTSRVSTANGVIRAAPARLDTLVVGNVAVRDVAALVMPDGALTENLLGMSFLSRLRRFSFDDGRLILEQ